MIKLFLASSFKDVAKQFANFETNLIGKRVTFIPTASIVEEVTFYVSAGRKSLEKLGLIIDELELSTATAEEIEHKIKYNDFIYITGGNTFYLMQELIRTGADQLILSEVHSGKLYIGESAGAIITSSNIEYVQKMDRVEKAPLLTNYTGLSLVEFSPLPHFKSFPFTKIVDKIVSDYEKQLHLIPIRNKEAIIVANHEMKIV